MNQTAQTLAISVRFSIVSMNHISASPYPYCTTYVHITSKNFANFKKFSCTLLYSNEYVHIIVSHRESLGVIGVFTETGRMAAVGMAVENGENGCGKWRE